MLVFLPAVDVRSRHTGDVRSPGVQGLFWTSTPVLSGSAWRLYIRSLEVDAGGTNTHPRPWGMSVRCVQELTEKNQVSNPHISFCEFKKKE